MSYIQIFIEELKRRVTAGSRITREETPGSALEFLDEAPRRDLEVLSDKIARPMDFKPRRVDSDIYAMDTSSRAIEAPYVFISIGAGSVYSRFSGRGIDVPDIKSIIGLEAPCCKHIAIVPEVELESDIIDKFGKYPGVMIANPLGITYSSIYDKHIVLVELRLSLENCLLRRFVEQGLDDKVILFIDGPLIYPSIPVHETRYLVNKEKLKIYIDSIEYLNMERLILITKLIEKSVVLLSVVKRLQRSYYLSIIDPMELSVGRINDEAYISTLTLRNLLPIDKPVIIGPLGLKHESKNITRLMWYIVVPRRLYPMTGGIGNYVTYRVEPIDTIDEEPDKILEYILYDSINMGSLLPLSILIVDRRVKKLTSSITSYMLYSTGLSEEATSQYISVL
ncbi:MAG: DNA double-strand break repair nuclease NurA [Desulfurococcaceae archaeon]